MVAEKQENVNNNHPELKPGEMFLTNSSNKDYIAIGYATKRKGMVAYSIAGKDVSDPGFFPVFISKSEYARANTKNI